jgi:hypothetical protein
LRLDVPLPHNLKVTDVEHNGSGRPAGDRPVPPSPLPVPELSADPAPADPAPPPGPRPSATVSDEDRNRFGLLLDHAAERGLLAPAEYQVRLRELAEATSVEQMTRIVSELPAFTAVPPTKDEKRRAKTYPMAPGLGTSQPPVQQRRSPPWVLLIMVIVTIALALVFLGVYAAHAVHAHNPGVLGARAIFSGPRL